MRMRPPLNPSSALKKGRPAVTRGVSPPQWAPGTPDSQLSLVLVSSSETMWLPRRHLAAIYLYRCIVFRSRHRIPPSLARSSSAVSEGRSQKRLLVRLRHLRVSGTAASGDLGALRWGYFGFTGLALVLTAPLAVGSWLVIEKHARSLKGLTLRSSPNSRKTIQEGAAVSVVSPDQPAVISVES